MDNNTQAPTNADALPQTAPATEVEGTIVNEMPVVERKPGEPFNTSFIEGKSVLTGLRPTTAEMSIITIEVIHVIVFVLITAFLFLSMWKDAKKS
jgi:hypothetical protein